MKNRVNTFLLLTFFSCCSYGQNDQPIDYSFTINLINPKDGLIGFEYINKSKIAQCLRSDDLELKLIEDGLYVYYESGESVKYIGDRSRLGALRAPKKYFILPPQENMRGTIKLNDYYEIKNKTVSVSYSIPVIPCEQALRKTISIPPVSYLKDKINNPTVEKTDVYATDYPEWTQYGFIAVTKPLVIDRSKK